MIINKDSKGRTLYYVAADVILMQDDNILMQRRANTGWSDGKWNFIGGHIEDDETLHSCVIREVKEEIGIDICKEDLKLVHCMQFKANRLTIQFYFVCKKWNGTPKIQPEQCNGEMVYKSDKLQWFNINELPENLTPSANQAIKEVLKGSCFSSIGF